MLTFLGLVIAALSVFLILLVLVQRGRGGGLAGALGGMGGQSAFGAKAGDVFTKFTIAAAASWILLCVLMVKLSAQGSGDALDTSLGQGAETTEESTLDGPLEGPLSDGTDTAPTEDDAATEGAESDTLEADRSEPAAETTEPDAAAPAEDTTEPADTAEPAAEPAETTDADGEAEPDAEQPAAN